MADQLLTTAQEDRMTWKPISSAPRDGTPIILYHPEWQVKRLQGGWDAHEEAWRVHGWGCPATQPDLWHPMPPLPEPPKETDDGR